MWSVRWLALVLLGIAPAAFAQLANPTRLAILEAEDRRATAAADLIRLRAGVTGNDPQAARLAVRALGRLERPTVIPDILPALGSRFVDVRVEAAHAVAQAASGLRRGATGGPRPDALFSILRDRLETEEDSSVRAALAESLARLPFDEAAAVDAAQETLVLAAGAHTDVTDRVGVAKAFEALVRLNKGTVLRPAALALLQTFVGVASPFDSESLAGPLPERLAVRLPTRSGVDAGRDARVRRLALEALTTAKAIDAAVVEKAATDPDPQVRRLAVRAAGSVRLQRVVTTALEDVSAMVRLEAVRAVPSLLAGEVCAWTLAATADADVHVVLQAIDQLRACGRWDQAVTRLADLASDAVALRTPRQWHRPAHALVALAQASPERSEGLRKIHASAANPFVRVYAARAAAATEDRALLETLAADANDNVVEAAIDGLAAFAGGQAVASYVAALPRRGYQAVRAAARALAVCTTCPELPRVVEALRAAHDRLTREGSANSIDARSALESTLAALGAPLGKPVLEAGNGESRAGRPTPLQPTLEELQRWASPRARLKIRDLGVIDVALIAVEAPLTVVHVSRLAERGYYDGLTIHRVVPNFVLQGGSPDANEYVGHPDHMRDEVGSWPHVRGALGISTRGRDTGDAQFFIDLTDNPRLDHEYTVFGQVLTGMDVADRVLEGDVIESVQILP